jgi:hypothetical protein
MVEFALILFPLLILVSGIIYFGIGLNYWLDEQRIANQGARWAAVNNWPTCPRGSTDCSASSEQLQTYLKDQALSNGLRDSVTVTISTQTTGVASTLPGDSGTPVKVRLASPFTFVPILGIRTITLVPTQQCVSSGTPASCWGGFMQASLDAHADRTARPGRRFFAILIRSSLRSGHRPRRRKLVRAQAAHRTQVDAAVLLPRRSLFLLLIRQTSLSRPRAHLPGDTLRH